MARLLYFAFPTGPVLGGHKMILRHVEALRGLGFDAVCVIGRQFQVPKWVEHRAPILREFEFRKDDVVVLPDDAHDSLRRVPPLGLRCVVFAQNPYLMASLSLDALDAFPANEMPTFMAVSPGMVATIQRLYPRARAKLVPCFVDERIFRLGGAKQSTVAFAPKKRMLEASAVKALFSHLHPRHASLGWRELQGLPERQVADALQASSLFLSLSRLESVGMTPLEAMASGCLCAGFLGVGGREFATHENGFWAPDDDCEAAADALACAADVVKSGGPELNRRVEAGQATARLWSYTVFRRALEAFWMKEAPDARLRPGPLD